MELLYKPEWEEAKKRFLAYWEREFIDRCTVAVTAPRKDVPPEPAPALPAKVEDRWLDLDYIRAWNEHHFKHTFFGGEAIPMWNAGYPNWDSLQCFPGCPITLADDTGWVDPIISEGSLTDYDYREFRISADNVEHLYYAETLAAGDYAFVIDYVDTPSLNGYSPDAGFSYTLTPVPEPTSAVGMGLWAAMLPVRRRPRRPIALRVRECVSAV
jgi:hypothetical protein